MAHSPNSQEWFSIDGGEFPSISANGEQTIEFTQPTRFVRIEYWLENPDKFTLIRFYVEIGSQENPKNIPIEYSNNSEDSLLDTRALLEIFAFGEGIRVEDIDPEGWREHHLPSLRVVSNE